MTKNGGKGLKWEGIGNENKYLNELWSLGLL